MPLYYSQKQSDCYAEGGPHRSSAQAVEHDGLASNESAWQTASSSASILEVLLSFVPRSVVRHFVETSEGINGPQFHRKEATILFIDVSGFTALNERLAKERGHEGCEIVLQHLNSYFGPLIDLVHAHGGDVLKFAGDALICVFAVSAVEHSTARHSAIAAVDCALDILSKFGTYTSLDGVVLSLHIGIGMGSCIFVHAGGVGGFWEYFVTGRAFTELETCVDESSSGELVVSPTVHAYIKTVFSVSPRGAHGNFLVHSRHSFAVAPSSTEEFSTCLEVVAALGEAGRSKLASVLIGYVGKGVATFLDFVASNPAWTVSSAVEGAVKLTPSAVCPSGSGEAATGKVKAAAPQLVACPSRVPSLKGRPQKTAVEGT